MNIQEEYVIFDSSLSKQSIDWINFPSNSRKRRPLSGFINNIKSIYADVLQGKPLQWDAIKMQNEFDSIDGSVNEELSSWVDKKLKVDISSDEDTSNEDLLSHNISNLNLNNSEESLYGNLPELNNIWPIIGKLMWCDKDDGIMTERSIKYRLNRVEIEFLRDNITKYVNNLVSAFSSLNLFQDMSKEEVLNFMYHIIAKNKDYYNAVLEMPILALYLIDDYQYQPLYTLITTL